MFLDFSKRFLIISTLMILNFFAFNFIIPADVSLKSEQQQKKVASDFTDNEKEIISTIVKYGRAGRGKVEHELDVPIIQRIKIPLKQLVADINANARPGNNNNTLLGIAVNQLAYKLVNFLLALGADPLKKYPNGRSALEIASKAPKYKQALQNNLDPQKRLFTITELKNKKVKIPAGLFQLMKVNNVEELKKLNKISFNKNNEFVNGEIVIVPVKNQYQYAIIDQILDDNSYIVKIDNKNIDYASYLTLAAEEIGKLAENDPLSSQDNLILNDPAQNQIISIPAKYAVVEYDPTLLAINKNIQTPDDESRYFNSFFEFSNDNKFERGEIVGFYDENSGYNNVGIILYAKPHNEYVIQDADFEIPTLPVNKIGKMKLSKSLKSSLNKS